MLGAVRLDAYLEGAGLSWVVRLRELLRGTDVTELKAAYQAGGKAPFHPHVVLGLIVYGISVGMNSLRELEGLARRDVGAWWLTGGLQPDHSTLGRFFVRHAESIQGGLFEEVTRHVLRRLQLPTQNVAGDGTVIEAASSRFRLMTEEAALTYAKSAQGEQRAQALEAAQNAQERTAARAAKGRSGPALVARTEPEAVVQKLKDGRIRAGYKPSILANEHRMILAQTLDPSSETTVVESLVQQAERTLEGPVPTMSLDAGYFCLTVLLFCLKNDIDILCPSGRLDAEGESRRKRPKGRFVKADFQYREKPDVYVCPAGKQLRRSSETEDPAGHRLHVYRASTADCRNCELREKCTTAKSGRTLKRYADEEVLEAAREVMDHPSARARYRGRQASVEPVFSVTRARGFCRFRRRGRRGAATEFAMHCIAYNLERAARLEARAALCIVSARAPGGPWTVVAAFFLIAPS